MNDPLLESVFAELDRTVSASAPLRPRRSFTSVTATWASARLLPAVAAIAVLLLFAIVLDSVIDEAASPVVLLVAPVVPTLAVSIDWRWGSDPARELIQTSSRDPFALVLRRCTAVVALAVLILLAASTASGLSPLRWLLPSLGLTSLSLALGRGIGVRAACALVCLAWGALIVAPGVVAVTAIPVFDPSWTAVWITVSAVCCTLLVVLDLARRLAWSTDIRDRKRF
jgi:hypothetical protein